MDVGVIFASFAAFWREARSLVLSFLDDIVVEGSRSRLLLRFVLVSAKEPPMLRVCGLVVVVDKQVGNLLYQKKLK